MHTPIGFRAAFVLACCVALQACACMGAAAPAPATGSASGSALPLTAPLEPGTYGEAFAERALFQHCEIVDGVDFCAFHANGWKYYAYRGGPTPDALLDALESLPTNTPVVIAGDLILLGDITVEMALRQVSADRQGDPYAPLRAKLQGRWVSLDDPLSEIEVMGSEMRNMYGGRFLGLDFLQIAPRCTEAPPDAGPVLLRVEPEDHSAAPLCYGISFRDDNTLELIYMGRGNMLRYQRLVFPQP